MGFYSEIEKIIKDRSEAELVPLMKYYGITINVHEEKIDTYSNVYGNHANNNIVLTHQITAIITDGGYFTDDSILSGNFEDAFLYTMDELKVGDVVSIDTDQSDRKIRTYKVTTRESLGITVDILSRYKISSMAD